MAQSTETTGDLYDEVPFHGPVVPGAHPLLMATSAALVGRPFVPPGGARVLEIGCGCGQQSLAIADTLPGAEVIGIDLSAGEIEIARSLAEKSGLDNVSFHAMDVADLGDDFGRFDYVVCFGVYSWVPPETRGQIFRVMRDHLTDDGLAYLNYYVKPGWYMRNMTREIVFYHVRDIDDVYERQRQASALLEMLAADADPALGAGMVLIQEAGIATMTPVHHQVHDLLGDINSGCYFHELAEQAAGYDLEYVAESDVWEGSEGLPAPLQEKFDGLGLSPVDHEQYTDFALARVMRKSLLGRVHDGWSATFDPARIRTMYLSAQLPLEGVDLDSTDPVEIPGPRGGSLTVESPAAKVAIDHLTSIWPASLDLPALAEVVRARLAASSNGSTGEVDAAALGDLLHPLVVKRLVECTVEPYALVTEPGPRPAVSALTRVLVDQTAAAENRRLVKMTFQDLLVEVITRLDGERTLDEIAAEMAQLDGLQLATADGRTVVDPPERERALEVVLPQIVDSLAANGLLIS